jgi:hypothetical protein
MIFIKNIFFSVSKGSSAAVLRLEDCSYLSYGRVDIMMRWLLVIFSLVVMGGNLQAAFVFESQERQMNLTAQAGSTLVQMNCSSTDLGKSIFDQSIKASGNASDVMAVGRQISVIQPGSIFYSFSPSLLAGKSTGSAVENMFASYHTLLNIVFSVTDSPLDLNITKNLYGGTLGIVDSATGLSVVDLNSPSTVTLQPGRYTLSSEFGISKSSPSDDPFYMDFEGISSLSVTYDATTCHVPEPSTFLIFSLLGGLGLFLGWRKQQKACKA